MYSPSIGDGGGDTIGPTFVSTPLDSGKFEPNSHWKDAPNHECYSSFGDDGTTATVNAYGDIIQFSKYIGKGHSGMFSADHQCVSEPYLVEKRTTDLQSLIRQFSYDKKTTYGSHFPELKFLFRPELTYVHNRWPRFDDVLEHDWQRTAQKEFDNFQKFEDLRAHLRSESSGLSRFSTSWMVHDGVVFQHCVVSNNSVDQPLPIKIQFEENMLIRDLDHLDPDYASNRDSKKEMGNHYTSIESEGKCWVRRRQLDLPQSEQSHEKEGDEKVETDSVAVIVSVFIDNDLQSWTLDVPTDASYTRNPWWSYELNPRRNVEITIAYKMCYIRGTPQHTFQPPFTPITPSLVTFVREHLAAQAPDKETFCLSSLSPVSDTVSEDAEEGIQTLFNAHTSTKISENRSINPSRQSPTRFEDPSGKITSGSPLGHLEYFARRNLEHILSVCAIPRPKNQHDMQFSGAETNDIPPVALTCGDLAFHRVNTAASFFAFEFLIETANRLKHISLKDDDRAKGLMSRVKRICIGHLLWLISICKDGQPFAANYWPSGSRTTAMKTDSWQPEDFETDSAYQWIKIQKCLNVFKKELGSEKKAISDVLRPAAVAWRKRLKDLDNRAVCAWPHSREDDINIFRLSDHIWIWKGLQAIEEIESSLRRPEDRMTTEEKENQGLDESETYASRNVPRQVIRNFTTKNDGSGKRSLAVTRSSRENRFLFHARDTVLVYAQDWGFISDQDPNSVEVWQNAMHAQREHDENHEFAWEKALRYALSISMAFKGCSINKKPSSRIIKDSLATLAESSSPNGLFVGLLDKRTKQAKKSVREEDRDSHFHAGFEISIILFKNARTIIDAFETKPPPKKGHKNTSGEKMIEMAELIAQQVTQQIPQQTLQINKTSIPYDSLTDRQRSSAYATKMKKAMPLSLLMDANSVVDVGDEWLYNYPGFLVRSNENPITFDKAIQNQKNLLKLQWQDAPEELDWLKELIDKALISKEKELKAESQEAKVESRNFRSSTVTNAPNNDVALEETIASIPRNTPAAIFDIPKKPKTKKEKGRYDEPGMLTIGEFWDRLGVPRTANISKKRFVWLTSNHEDLALRCYLRSHDDEKPAVLQLMYKNVHAKHSFRDETTMYLNTWETELHISFYQLLGSNLPNSNDRDQIHDIKFTFPRYGGHAVTKASMGFCFSGDFFDRFWTCHFIESRPVEHSGWDLWLPGSPPHQRLNQSAWGQRKVLELHLFERILIAMLGSTKDLFRALKKAVNLGGDQGAIFSVNLKNINYSEKSRDWEGLQQALKLISDDMERVNSTIIRWETREVDRGVERPRWTRNDEKKYRRDINKLMVSTSHKIQEFRSLHAEIKSFAEWLASYQQQIREETSFRDSENIKFFTYVTVIFLPLGFASSIFSMSAVPEQDMVRRMVTTAIVALVITILAIVSAPVIKSGFNQAMENSLKRCKVNSVLFQLHDRPVEPDTATQSKTDGMNEISQQSSNVKQDALADEMMPDRSISRRAIGMTRPAKAGRQHYSQRRRRASDTSIWLWCILTELPAQIVVSAYERMVRGDISFMTLFNVIIGIIVLPWCLIALMARIIVINVADLISIISLLVLHTFDELFISEAQPREHLEFLLEPSGILRPLRTAKDILAKQKNVKAC